MSPIEHVCDALDRRIRQRVPVPAKIQQLHTAIEEEWTNIPQVTINNLINSMWRRRVALREANGGHTRYWLVFRLQHWRCWSAVPDYSTQFNPELLSCWNSIIEAQWIHLNTSHWDLHDSCDELRSKFVRLAFTAARLFWTSLEPQRQAVPPCKYCTFYHTKIHRFCERWGGEMFYPKDFV